MALYNSPVIYARAPKKSRQDQFNELMELAVRLWSTYQQGQQGQQQLDLAERELGINEADLGVRRALQQAEMAAKQAEATQMARGRGEFGEFVGRLPAEPFNMMEHGRIGAAPPLQERWRPLPEDPYAASIEQAGRIAYHAGHEALKPELLKMLPPSRLPGSEQTSIVRREYGLEPPATESMRDTTTRRGQDIDWTSAKLRADVDRERIAAEAGRPKGTWVDLTNEQGVITNFYNPTTGEVRANPVPGTRNAARPFGERQTLGTIESFIEDLDTAESLARNHPEALGAIRGRAYGAARNIVNVDPEVNDLFNVTGRLSAERVYQLSGKQINERERADLKRLTPRPEQPSEQFYSNLRAFRDLSQRLLQKYGVSATATPQAEIITTPDGKKWRQIGNTMVEVP